MFSKKEKKAFIIIIGVTIFVFLIFLIPYWINFGTSPSSNHTDWAEFGNYIAVPLAFVAFIGVIFTAYLSLKISKSTNNLTKQLEQEKAERELISEERSVFYKTYEIYQKNVNNMNFEFDKKIIRTGPSSFQLYVEALRNKIIAFVITDFYLEIYSFRDIPISDPTENGEVTNTIHSFLHRLYDGIEALRIVKENQYTQKQKTYASIQDHTNKYHGIKNSLQWIPTENAKKMMQSHLMMIVDGVEMLLSKDNESAKIDYIATLIMYYCYQNKRFDKLNETYRAIANNLYEWHEAFLGIYFRNIYLLLDTVDKFTHTPLITKTSYISLIKATLSRYEIALLANNFLSDRATSRTRELYLKYGVLNNLNSFDILLGYSDIDLKRLFEELKTISDRT